MTAQPVVSRPMRWWDVEALLPLERELFAGDAWSAETWWGELAQPGRQYLVVELADAVTAYAGVAMNGSNCDVMTVAVAPRCQGRGVARALVRELITVAAEQGATQLMLEVRADNVAAQRLYRGLGFERIAARRGYYLTSGGAVDAWIMRLRPLPAAAPPAG